VISGGASFKYIFSTDTTQIDPGNGFLKLNNTDSGSATKLYISEYDETSTLIEDFLRTVADNTSTIKGYLKISEKDNSDEYAFYIVDSVFDNGTYFDVSLTYLTGTLSPMSFIDARCSCNIRKNR